MNILITGAAGFIASHIIEELLKNSENKIFGIDNFYSGKQSNIEYLKSIDNDEKFVFMECDIRDYALLNEIVKTNKITQIYHLAALVSVQESIENPLLSHEVNVKGTLNILEVSKTNDVKRVVFSSSAAVYGDEPTLPKNENSLVKPISPYGLEKLMCEYYMKLYTQLYSVETVILRYFNVYGERQSSTSDYSGVISIFENKLKNGITPNIYGDGKQYRDFVYVKDVASINIKAMNMQNIAGETFCVGTGHKTSINDLFNFISQKYKIQTEPNYMKSRDGDILESVCSNEKILKYHLIDKFKIFKNQIGEINVQK